MVGSCANPQCAKPLHYLRDGRIFIFDVADASAGPGGKRLHHLDHYWLCGLCSQTLILLQEGHGVRIVPKPQARRFDAYPDPYDSVASAALR